MLFILRNILLRNRYIMYILLSLTSRLRFKTNFIHWSFLTRRTFFTKHTSYKNFLKGNQTAKNLISHVIELKSRIRHMPQHFCHTFDTSFCVTVSH